MKAPQGVEKVLALATLSPEWRAKVLADPLAAAREADIELGEAGLRNLRITSPQALAELVDSFQQAVAVPRTFGIRPDERRIDEPAPTIVGPRPGGGSGGKVSVPQGIERLLTLAATNASWKEKVLADPVAAASAAGIALSESERAILRATPRSSLEQMADSLARRPGMSPLGKTALAVGVSAAALLAAGVAVPSLLASSRGNRPDLPPTNPQKLDPVGTVGGDSPLPGEAPSIQSLGSLDGALAQAKQENRAVMAVFLHPAPVPALSSPERKKGTVEWKSTAVVFTNSKEFHAAAGDANLILVRVTKPTPPFVVDVRGGATEAEQKLVDKYKENLAAYEAALKKYGLDGDGKLPAVVFLAPDGSELSKLVQPTEEAQLIEAVKAVPPLMAKWFGEHPTRTP